MRIVCLAIAAALLVLPAHADERTPENLIRLPESLALTPDGTTLVFSWRGDLWRAPTAGGPAQRLTFHPAADTRPHVSPDGSQIAFASTRSGAEQVHVMPLAGGPPRQVTIHTEGGRAYGWFPDGAHVLVRSKRDHHWRGADRLLRKSLDPDVPGEVLFDAECGHGAVSPDGRWLAFTREGMSWTRKGYRGPRASQLWLFDLRAKTFRRLSQGDHGELWPQWAPDSRTLHYVSEEDGTWNLWSRDITSGARSQITHHENDGATWPSVSADGSAIVYRKLFDVFRVAPSGGKPVQVLMYDTGDPTVEAHVRRTLKRASAAAFTDDGREIAIAAGGDIWVMDTELREPRRVTNTAAEERDPVFSRDFKSLWLVSDAAGSTDIWKFSRTDDDAYWWQNERFRGTRITEDDAVESDLRLTPDGTRLAYLKGADLWSMALDGSDAREHVTSFTGIDWSFSPDGRWIAYARPDDDFNWDVWITPVDGSADAVNVSRHPDNDHNPAWSPDGKVLAFTGRRWEQESDICYVWLRAQDDELSPRDRTLEKALKKMEGRKKKAKRATKPGAGKAPATPPPAAASALSGRWTGRLSGPPPIPEDGLDLHIEIVQAESGATLRIEVVGQFSGTAESFAIDEQAGTFTFALTTPLGALSGRGTVAAGRMQGSWSVEGLMEGTFEGTRQDEEASAPPKEPGEEPGEEPSKEPGKKTKPAKTPEPVEVDLEGIADRIQRISIPDGTESDLVWSPDGKKLAFRGTVKGKAGLYTVEFPDKLTPKLLTTVRGSGARWLQEGKQIVWLAAGVPASVSAAGKGTSYAFTVRQEVFLPDLHAAVFDQAWRIMRDNYYDERMGNRDWKAVRAKYRPIAAGCLTAADLDLAVNMMLGELNGSHLGFRASKPSWSRPGWRDVTGHLGCRFVPGGEGPGLRILDVVKGTPAHEKRSRLVAGETVMSIDGHLVGPETNLARLMTGDPERTVEVHVRAADGVERTVRMRPTSYAAVRRRLYDHWAEHTRARIHELSAGRLGYLHVRSMNWSSFLRFEAELYKAGHGRDGLIIDVRDNGGGFTTDHLLTCLTQPRHAVTVPRRGGRGYPHDRMVYAPWHKPVIVLCNQNSFSNAEIFAHAIKTLGRGPVVGVQTAGGVISTGGTTVMGFGSLRLPFRGWYLVGDGEDMELNGCVPHHVVWPHPSDHGKGEDRQVAKAVEVGLAEVSAWKARGQPPIRNASERPKGKR